jgi:hypothetical protein
LAGNDIGFLTFDGWSACLIRHEFCKHRCRSGL